jgi:hypothetical protein
MISFSSKGALKPSLKNRTIKRLMSPTKKKYCLRDLYAGTESLTIGLFPKLRMGIMTKTDLGQLKGYFLSVYLAN